MKTYEEHLIARLRNGALVDENLRDEAADFIENVVAENEKLHSILGKVADLEYYRDWETQQFVFRLTMSDMLDETAAWNAIGERIKFLIKNREGYGKL